MGKLRPTTLVFCLLFLAVGIPGAQAQWAPGGAVVTEGLQAQDEPQVVSDGQGGALFLWKEFDALYAQRLDVGGARRWGTDNRPVCTATGSYPSWPFLVSDGNLGAFVAWQDTRGTGTHAYVQHLNFSGLAQWAADGLWIDTGVLRPRILTDGTGGAFVGWETSTIHDIAVQRLDASGATLWSGDFVDVGTGNTVRLLSDGADGVIVGWESTDFFYDAVFGMRLDGFGSEVWGSRWVSQTNQDCNTQAELATDGAGGGLWVWEYDGGLRAQLRDAAGVRQWPESGVIVDTPFITGSDSRLVSDGAGGALILFADTGEDVYLNRLGPDGVSIWGGVVTVCDHVSFQNAAQLAPDGHGGAFVVWEDYRNSTNSGIDIYAQHIDANGVPQWTTDGVAICTADRDQSAVQITATGNHSAIIAWQDARAGDVRMDIYAQTVNIDGSIGDPPFEVMTTDPPQNALHMPVNTDIRATLSETVSFASLSSIPYLVHGSLSGLHDVNPSVLFGILTLNPVVDFTPGEVVTVVLTDGIEAVSGKFLAPLCWSFTTAAEGVDGEFLAATEHAVDTGPNALCAADLDGDGDMDLVTANYDANSFSFMRSNGDGTFLPPVNYGVGDNPHAVIAVDVDRDGDLDVITADYGNAQVSVVRNSGGGIFLRPPTYLVGSGPESVCAGDFNHDGWLDLATANLISDDVSVLLNNGDGTFALRVTYAGGDNPYFITSADLDGDGFADLVTANLASGDISIYLNDGTGSFAPRVDIPIGVFPSTVHPADLDGDGDLDLVVAGGADFRVNVLFNLGQAVFTAPVFYTAGSNPIGGLPADVDGDGHLDLVCANGNSDNVWVRLNDGSGNFGGEAIYPVGNDPVALVAADFDGDGALDLVTANRSGDSVSLLLNHRSLSDVELPRVPAVTSLRPNVPNPFNPLTRIDYAVKQDGHVRLVIYDARGREIATLVDEYQTAREHSVQWDGRNESGSRVASGVYFYKLIARDFEETRKMVLVK